MLYQVSPDDMSANGRAEYLKEDQKRKAAVERRLALGRDLQKQKHLVTVEEHRVLQKLISAPDKIVRGQADILKSPAAVECGVHLVEAALKEAHAARMMAIVSRDEYYEVELAKARAGRENLALQRREHRARCKTKKELEEFTDMEEYYATDTVQLKLDNLRASDKDFLFIFNGPMLDLIHALQEAELSLSARQAAAPAITAEVARKLNPVAQNSL
jgi:hypothetical protein